MVGPRPVCQANTFYQRGYKHVNKESHQVHRFLPCTKYKHTLNDMLVRRASLQIKRTAERLLVSLQPAKQRSCWKWPGGVYRRNCSHWRHIQRAQVRNGKGIFATQYLVPCDVTCSRVPSPRPPVSLFIQAKASPLLGAQMLLRQAAQRYAVNTSRSLFCKHVLLLWSCTI